MMTRTSSLSIACTILLQYLAGVRCEATANQRGNGLSIAGEAIVNGLAGPNGAVKVRFLDTDFQGLTMEVETDMEQNLDMSNVNDTSIPTYVPFQKISGAIDCVNQLLADDIVIVSGTIQGTANEPIVDHRPFKEGDRFMTAVRGNHHGGGEKDQVGEIANFGAQDAPDLSDCMYFMGSDFELREVVGGHITVY